MLAIEAASVVAGVVTGDHLFLTRHDGSQFDAGNVRGPAGKPQTRNLIKNSRFLVNQRWFDNQSMSNSNAIFGPDRWRVDAIGLAGWTPAWYSLKDEVPGALPESGSKYVRVDTALHHADPLSHVYLEQRIESVRSLSGTTAVVSFWAKINTAASQDISVFLIQVFGTSGSPAVTIPAGVVTVTNTWARYSVTVNVPSLAGKTINDANSYLSLRLYVLGGSGNPQVGVGMQIDQFDFWGVQLEAGLEATDLYMAPYTEDLASCQRYYWSNFLPADQPQGAWIGACAESTGQVRFYVPFPVAMRGMPTITGTLYYVKPSDGSTLNPFSSLTPMLDTVSLSYTNDFVGLGLRGNGASGLVIGQAVGVAGYLNFTAEL
jgi:hypothetical protein